MSSLINSSVPGDSCRSLEKHARCGSGSSRFRLWALAMVLACVPFGVQAVDQLNLFELDANFANDAVTADSCGWGLHDPCPGNWTDNVEPPGFTLIDGLVDMNKDGLINTSDTGTVTVGAVTSVTYKVKNGFIDIDGDDKVGLTEAGANDTCYYNGIAPVGHIAGGCFDGLDVLFGYVDFNADGVAPSIDGGEDAEDLFNGTSAGSFKFFFSRDDTNTQINGAPLCDTGIADTSNSDCTIFTGGGSKDPEVITEYDVDGNWVSGWEWTEGNLQPKNDINSAFAGTWLYEGASGTIHQTNDFILYYGLDIVPSSGAAVGSFWLLQDETIGPILAQGQTPNTRQFEGSHVDGDLLIQVNQQSNEANVFVWNPGEIYPGLPPNDTQTPNISQVFAGATCSTAGGEEAVCAVANTRQEPVVTDPAEWPYTHTLSSVTNYYEIYEVGNTIEGGVNVSAVYRELGIEVPCFSKAVVSTRTTESTSGTLTDFMLTGFESCALEIRKTGDVIAMVGDTVTFNIEIENTGILPLYLSSASDPGGIGISDPLVDGQSGAGTAYEAAVAFGCDELQPREICSFPLTYDTSQSDSDPFQNTISALYISADGNDTFSASDDHWVDLIYPASIGDQVWLDENGNGVFDAGEDGLAGVTVILVPDLDVIAGQGIDINGDGVINSNDDGEINGITIIDGLVDLNGDGDPTNDTGTFQNFTVTNGVVSGTTTVNGDTQTTVTDANGEYIFSHLLPGNYSVDIVPPAGLVPTYDVDGGFDNSSDLTLAISETNTSTDFGLNWVAPGDTTAPGPNTTGAIGDRIWNDADGDGFQDVGEAGVANVGVVLTYDSNGDGVIDAVYGSTVTDGSGNYIFDDLPSGIYEITVIGDITSFSQLPADGTNIDPATGGTPLVPAVPTGFTQTGDPDEPGVCSASCDNATSSPIILAPGDVYVNADFGYQNTALRDVSGTVYLDADVDGANDTAGGPDAGIGEMTVSLALEVPIVDGLLDLNRSGAGTDDNGILDGIAVIGGRLDLNGDGVINDSDDGYFNGFKVIDGYIDVNGNGDDGTLNVIVASTTTNADGSYTFTDVEQGYYSVIVTDTNALLSDSYQTGDPGEGGVCSVCDDAHSIQVTTSDVTAIDFGYAPAGHEAGEGLISGTVGIESINDNDLVDPGEELAGVDMILYQLFDVEEGLVDLNNDELVFGDDGYVAGSDSGLLDGYRFIDGKMDFDGDGVANDTETDAISCTCIFDGYFVEEGFLGTGEVSPPYPFPIFTPLTETLELELDTETTDSNGFYEFAGLDPDGQYSVKTVGSTLPTGTLNDFDFSGPATDGVSYVNLFGGSGIQTDVDFGVIGTNSISGSIWNDVNADGSNGFDGADAPDGTPNETALGFANVTVELRAVFNVINGQVDIDGDGVTAGDTGDYGYVNGILVIAGKLDVDGDGVITAADDGAFQGYTVTDGVLSGSTAQLQGDVIATTTTDGNGDYTFDNLPNGTFTVKVTDENRVLDGYWLSDGQNDNDDNNSQVDPYYVTLSGNTNNDTADFGYYIDPASVGNTLFKDFNGNGIQDAGETGFSGVEVVLTITYPGADPIYVVTTTDAYGNYSFGNLLLDEDDNGLGSGQPTYSLSVDSTQPELTGYLSTENQAGTTDDLLEGVGNGVDSDADIASGTAAYPLQGGFDDTNDFGFALPSAVYGNATGLVWLDVDYDGVWDVGEPGIDGVTVNLYADRDGDGDPDADIFVTGNALDLDGDGFADGSDDGYWYGIEVINGLLDVNGDGVVDSFDDGSVTTIDGITYLITDGAIQADGAIDGAWDQTVTDANGNYSFGELPPGDYQVLVDPNELLTGDLFGLDPTAGNDGSFDAIIGGTTGFNLTAGENEVVTSLGYIPDEGTAAIAGTVFSDAINQGVLDPSEIGISDITVNLYADNDGDGIYDDFVATTTTGPDGSYILTGVAPGDYVVKVDTSDPDLIDFCASLTLFADCNTTATTSNPITLLADDTVSGVNFGFDNPATYTITDTVWDDLNGDGVQDPGEAGIGGVTVDIYDCGIICGDGDDVIIATVITDENGDFVFDGVPDGTYKVAISDNNGVLNDYYETTGTGGSAVINTSTDDLNFDGVINTVGDDGSATFGYRKPGTIAGTIYSDADGDGLHDGDESGLAGVTVELRDSLGALIATTVTGSDGSYSFEYIEAGDYQVVIPFPNGTQTGDPDGTLDNRTSVTLSAGESVLGLDFGYNDPLLSDISGTVFNDFNENAVHEPDGGDGLPGTTEDNEGGIAGVTVTLSPEYDIINSLLDINKDGVVNMDDDGFISGSIDDVQVIDGALDINGDGIINMLDTGTFNGIAVINGYLDTNGDGQFGADTGTVVADPIATAITDADGNYEFVDVPDGNYVVAVTDDDNVVDAYTLTSGLDERAVTAVAGTDVSDIDFGYVLGSGTGSIGDTVWLDSNGDGLPGANEAGISGVTVELFSTGPDGIQGNGDDFSLGTTVTDANGTYLFDGLEAGNYYVDVIAGVPAGLQLTTGATDPTGIINLSEGEAYLDADIGYIPGEDTAILGDTIWYDTDGDGIQDPGEAGIGGVTIIIIDAAGNKTEVVTNPDGSWFAVVPATSTVPVDYVVTVDKTTLPGGVISTPTNMDGGDTYIVPVAEGDVRLNLDFGYAGGVGVIIGDTVYLDSNANGTQDAGEEGISGVNVKLLSIEIIDGKVDVNGDGVISTDGSDDGSYGGYTVTNGVLDVLAVGQIINGYAVLSDGTGGAALDINGNSVIDATDDLASFVVANAVTDSDGNYLFTGILPGDYQVRVDAVTGLTLTTPKITQIITLDTDAATTGIPAIYLDADFGYTPTAGTAAIGDRIWSDADGDGVQDAGEIGIGGVTVELYDATGTTLIATTTTAPDGSYLFTDVPASAETTYVVQVNTTTGGLGTYTPTGEGDPGTACSLSCDSKISVTVGPVSGVTNTSADFGYQDTANAAGSINGTVYDDINGNSSQDSGEGGFPAVSVKLVDLGADGLLGTADDKVIATTATDGNGDYSFYGLPGGNYAVVVTDATMLLEDKLATETPVLPISIDCTPTCNSVSDVDFGYTDAVLAAGSIGDTVYFDTNGNGVQDAGEVGISGVSLSLFTVGIIDGYVDLNGDGIINASDTGSYGGYTVTAGVLPPAANGDIVNGFSVVSDGLGGYGLDVSGDGFIDASDDKAPLLLDTEVTGPGGIYTFDGIPAGDYRTVVTDTNGVLADLIATQVAPVQTVTCDPVTDTCDEITTADFGYKSTTGDTGTIGGTVWHDTIQITHEGTLELGEPGIQGVTVELWLDINNDGIIEPGIDNLVRTTTTDANGDYLFLGMPPANYIVNVTDDNNVLSGQQWVASTDDPNADNNSHVDPYPVTLGLGEVDTSVDFAYEAVNPFSISGVVFEDAGTSKGTWDDPSAGGDDAVVPGATVNLYKLIDGVEYLVGTTVTDGTGGYSFPDLSNGETYVVRVDVSGTDADSWEQTVDPDTAGALCTACDSATTITISGSDVTDLNFGYWNGDIVTTPVTLSYFEAVAGEEEGDVEFYWSTTTEAGNVGFDLYVVTANGSWMRVNEDFIPAIVAGPVDVREYSYSATGVVGDIFYIVDIDITGTELEHGPFSLNQAYGATKPKARPVDVEAIQKEHSAKKKAHKERKKAKMKEKLKKQKDKLKKNGRWEASASQAKPNWATRLAGGVLSLLVGSAHAAELPVVDTGLIQFHTTQSGVHRVTYEQLAEAGLDLNGVDPDVIALTNQGEAVAIAVDYEGKKSKRFGSRWYIEFLGEELNSLYSNTNVYTLYLDEALARRIETDTTRIARGAEPEASYQEVARVEQQSYYSFSGPGGDPWYMTRMLAYKSAYSNDFEIELEAYAGDVAPVTLNVEMWGLTNWPDEGDDHHVQVSFNETLVADEWFDGLVNYPVESVLPGGVAREGTNVLNVTMPYDTGFLFDLVNLDSYEVTYPRRFEARAGQHLDFSASGGVFEVSGLTSEDITVYRTDADGGVSVLDRTNVIEQGDSSFHVQFPGTDAEARYVVFTGAAIQTPVLEPVPGNVDITAGEAKYLIIAHPDFIGVNATDDALYSLEDLKLAREARGYSVVLADVEQVYAQFGHGVVDAQAIRDYIAYAYANMGTEMVLLVGGDTFDYHGYTSTGPVSFVPSLYAQTGSIVYFAPVDPKYADVNDDNVPDLAIGRLPVRSSLELSQVVKKTLFWDGNYHNEGTDAYGRTALFVADGYDAAQDYDFKQDAEDMRSKLPLSWQDGVVSSYLDDLDVTTARNTINDSLNSGVALTSFVGHSDAVSWTFDNLFNSVEAGALTNTLRPTVVTQWGCWNTYYVSDNQNTMAHELLLSGEQGAVVVLGASTLTEAPHERALAKLVYDRLFIEGVDLGAAILAAKQEYALRAPEHLDVILGWTLLGDPALMMNEAATE